MYRGHRNEIRPRDLEAAGRHQGCPGPVAHAAVLRRLYAALSARPAPVRDGVLDLNLKGAWSSSPRAPNGPTSPAARASAISPARPRRGARQGEGRRPGQGGRARPRRVHRRRRRRRSATSPTRSAACARRASRSSLMRSATPTTATSSLRPHRKSGSIRSAPSLIAGPGGSNLYYKGLLDKLGVTANVYRVGTYKSAVEPFIRNDMSPEARQNYMALDQAPSWKLATGASSRRGPRPMSTCS